MLMEERFNRMLELVNEQGTVSVPDLSAALNTSESTIRRDITTLDERGLLKKVHGGAARADGDLLTLEYDMVTKETIYKEEKQAIGSYAAEFIEKGDFVYLDAGTSTQALAQALDPRNADHREAVYVTNGLSVARALTHKNLRVYLIGGFLRMPTEALVGQESAVALGTYHFTKGFFGTNGIHLEAGFTTPDIEEAGVKRAALSRCRQAYVLSDPSKFGIVTPVSFGGLDKAAIITTKLPDVKFRKYTDILEVNP